MGACQSIVNSEGKVNLFTLAKNARKSVDQVESENLWLSPLAKELSKNLRSFGE
jgi:hypothetical protein